MEVIVVLDSIVHRNLLLPKTVMQDNIALTISCLRLVPSAALVSIVLEKQKLVHLSMVLRGMCVL
jgi:hypothetical protein